MAPSVTSRSPASPLRSRCSDVCPFNADFRFPCLRCNLTPQFDREVRMRLKMGLFIALVLIAGTAKISAQGRVKGNDRNTTIDVSVSIGRNDERIIREWFSEPANMRGLPPGLAKKEHLPPGLQKQLARNGQLPPGLQKRIQPLPPTLETRLTRLPEGRRRVIISGSVILLDDRKNLILDMIGVF